MLVAHAHNIMFSYLRTAHVLVHVYVCVIVCVCVCVQVYTHHFVSVAVCIKSVNIHHGQFYEKDGVFPGDV